MKSVKSEKPDEVEASPGEQSSPEDEIGLDQNDEADSDFDFDEYDKLRKKAFGGSDDLNEEDDAFDPLDNEITPKNDGLEEESKDDFDDIDAKEERPTFKMQEEEPLPQMSTAKRNDLTGYPTDENPHPETSLDDLAQQKSPVVEDETGQYEKQEPVQEAHPRGRYEYPEFKTNIPSEQFDADRQSEKNPLLEQGEEDFDIPRLRPRGNAITEVGYEQSEYPQGGYPEARRPLPRPAAFGPTGRPLTPDRRRRGSWLHVIILALIGAAVVGGTIYFLKNQSMFAGQQSEPTPVPATTTITPAASPSASPELIRADFKVKVMNGTTKTGLAATVSDKLASLGYQMDKPSNAPRQNYKVTEVKVKEGKDDLLNLLIKDLSSDYEASAGATLSESDPNDAQVILGLK